MLPSPKVDRHRPSNDPAAGFMVCWTIRPVTWILGFVGDRLKTERRQRSCTYHQPDFMKLYYKLHKYCIIGVYHLTLWFFKKQYIFLNTLWKFYNTHASRTGSFFIVQKKKKNARNITESRNYNEIKKKIIFTLVFFKFFEGSSSLEQYSQFP